MMSNETDHLTFDDFVIDDSNRVPPLKPRRTAKTESFPSLISLENIIPILRTEVNPTGWRPVNLLARLAMEIEDRADYIAQRLPDLVDRVDPQDQMRAESELRLAVEHYRESAEDLREVATDLFCAWKADQKYVHQQPKGEF